MNLPYGILLLNVSTEHLFHLCFLLGSDGQQMDRAASIIDEMVLAGVVPNERSYTTLMEGYARVGEIVTAFQYFKRIKEEGLDVDVVSYGSLLKACCKAGRMQNAIAVTAEMAAAGLSMNNYIYNILLDGYLPISILHIGHDLGLTFLQAFYSFEPVCSVQ